MELKSSNPVLGRTFEGSAVHTGYGKSMTISGTVNKAGILMILVAVSAAWVWNQFFNSIGYDGQANPGVVSGYMMLGALGGFVAAMVTVFKKEWAAVTAPVYALLEGLFLGGFSAIMELRFPGIAIQAVALTFGTCLVMLMAYRSGLIRPTQKFM